MPFLEIEFSDLEFYERLGGGAAGTVYRALWRGQETVVAVKKLLQMEREVSLVEPSHSTASHNSCFHFSLSLCLTSQAEVLSSLSHRNIVQFLGAVTVAPNYCLVTGPPWLRVYVRLPIV